MSLMLGFHPLVQRDLNEILDYYASEAGLETADRFESEFRAAIATIQRNPRHFHSIKSNAATAAAGYRLFPI